MSTIPTLPFSVQQKLVELAHRLPKAARQPFVVNTAKRLSHLPLDCQETLILGTVGYLIGHLLDQLLTVHLPFSNGLTHLSGGMAGNAGGLIGAFMGARKDMQRHSLEQRIAKVVAEELRKALQDVKYV